MGHLVSKVALPANLTDGEEKQLTNFLVSCSRIGCVCSRKQVRNILGRRNCCQEDRQETRRGYDYHRVVVSSKSVTHN